MQRQSLHAFRRAAAALYRVFADEIQAPLGLPSKGGKLHSDKALRAAVPALRLTLLEGEAANFEKVIEALRLLQDSEVSRRADTIGAAWKRVEQGHITFHGEQTLGGKEIRDAWIYGAVTHHGPQWGDALAALHEHGELAVFALQVSIVAHARLIMRLDAVIAGVLGEPMLWDDPSALEEKFFV